MKELNILDNHFFEKELVYNNEKDFLLDIDTLVSLQGNVQAITYPNDKYNLTKADIENDFTEPKDYHKEWLKDSRKWGKEYLGLLIYAEDNILIAMMTAYKNTFTYDNPIKGEENIKKEKVWLGNIFVDPKYQGKGIGKYLMDRLILWSEGLEIDLNVIEYNEKAIGFYKKFGFKYSHQTKEMKFNGKLIPEICMFREESKLKI